MKTDFIRNYSLHSGDYESLNSYEQRRYLTFAFFVTLSVIIAFCRLVITTFVSPIEYDIQVLFLNTLPLLASIVTSLVMTARNYYKVLVAFILIMPVILSVCNYYTADKNVEVFILTYIVLSFFFFDKVQELIASFLYNTIHLISIVNRDYFYLSGKMKVIPYDGALSVFNILSGMALLFFAFYIVKVQVWKYERVLIKRTLEMEELNHMKDKIFSTVAHDLKSPMAANLTLLKSLEKTTSVSPEDIRSYLAEIRTSVEETNNLVFDMLTWAKNEMQRTEPVITKIYIHELAREVMNEVKTKAKEKEIQLVCHIQDDEYMYADRPSLKIILRNLVTNALKFTASGGHVRLETVWKDGRFEIVVGDSGVGMSETKIKDLFSGNLFTTPGTNKEPGTGLGLLICNSLIGKSKGALHINSRENVGTEVKLCFPQYAIAN